MRKVYKTPPKKSNVQKTGAVSDIIMSVGPHAQDIINYGSHALAGGGLLALGGIRRKLKKMRGPEAGPPFTGGKK
jgi:hypothetical protein